MQAEPLATLAPDRLAYDRKVMFEIGWVDDGPT
jgi:hypothetical protein